MLQSGVSFFAMGVELRLKRVLVFHAIRPMIRPLRPERYIGALGASGFDGNVSKPFRNPNNRFLHTVFKPSKQSLLDLSDVGRRSATLIIICDLFDTARTG